MAGPTMQRVSTLVSKDISNYLTNQQTWGSILYNVKAYGAKGDGTTDDTAAIQSTINAVNTAGGGVVYFPSGTYMISGVLTIPGSDISLLSLDYGNAIIKLKNNASPIPFGLIVAEGVTKNNISIIGLIIDGNRTNNVDHGSPDVNGNQDPFWTGTLLALINLTSVDGVIIHDCIVRNSWGSGMWINDCTNVFIKENIVKDYRITGIAIRNNTSIVGTTTYVEVSGNDCSGGVVGIHNIFGPKYTQITSNFCSDNKDSKRFPSFAYSGTYPNIYPSTGGFVPNTDPGYVSPALAGDGAGIEMTGVYTDVSALNNEQISVADNICVGNMVGIRLEEETRYVTIDGNVCNNSEKHGIFLFSCFFNTISNNVCTGNLEHGINIEKLTSKAISEQNTIVGNTCNKNSRFGIVLQGARSNIITSNNLSDNNLDTGGAYGGVGLFVTDSTFCTRNIIQNNLFISYNGNDKYGVFSDSASHTNNILSGNVFQSQITAATNLTKSSNLITNNEGYKTSNFGQAFIASGNTTVTVAHGMPFSPFNGEIQVTPVNNVGSNWWVDGVDATNFVINASAAVGADTYFNWSVSEDKS